MLLAAARFQRVVTLRALHVGRSTIRWTPMTRTIVRPFSSGTNNTSGDGKGTPTVDLEIKRRLAFEAQRRVEIENLFNTVCSKDEFGSFIDSAGLGRLLVALGHIPGTLEYDRVLAHAAWTYGQRMSLNDLFRECDAYVRLDNVGFSAAQEELHEAFNVYDRDGSGSISPEELMTMLSTTGSHLTLEQARKIIALFDTNNDGQIDFNEFCSLLEEGVISWRFRTGYRVVFQVGGPGSGKGTLAERLVDKVHVAHVSTGDLLRQQSKAKSELGQELREIMQKGGLVGAHIVMRMLREFLQSQPGKRVLIDGFPRSVANLVDFEAVCGRAEFVLWFDAPDQVLIDRLLARGKTSGRADDQSMDTIMRRLAVYHSVVDPLRDYFVKNNYKIYRIDASQSLAEVEAQLLAIPEFALELERRNSN